MKIRKIEIPAADQGDGYTVYYVEVFIREYSWLIRKRYKEFDELHEKLVKVHVVEKALLPPKKLFGNLEANYVEKRRQSLEVYLQTLLDKFGEQLPGELNYFLEAHEYDVCGVTHNLAKQLFSTGDEILMRQLPYSLTPLQLYCITKRLELPAPTCDLHIAHGEIGNLYDFIQHLQNLKVCGHAQQVDLSDNVNFTYDLSLFKSLKSLEIDRCDVEPLQGLCRLQGQLESLMVHNSIHLLKDILVDDEMWEQGVLESVETDGITSLSPTTNYRSWKTLTRADFSKNQLSYIDESVALLPNVESLDLSHNCIDNIEHLQSLSSLMVLNLSHNKIQSLGTNLNAKLGNIKTLCLEGNHLDNVDGLEKLFSLVDLNLSSNNLTQVGCVLLLGQLPCLESLHLTGNTLTKESMYRVRVITAFEERADQISLDGQHPTSREMIKVQELLHEEQSFEIINVPHSASQMPTKNKQGNKKMKSVDRIIALEGNGTHSSSLTDSMSFDVDESDAEFRTRVEKIRQLGGDTWLTMLGEIQSEDTQGSRDDQVRNSESEERTTSDSRLEFQLLRIGDADKANSHSTGTGSPTSQDDGCSLRSNSETFIAMVSGVELGKTGTDPPRLHFGFTCALEELVRDRLETDTELTSGTYMVEVESTAEGVYEERMVGVDLCKGVILEIQIATGKTSARYKLDDVSSVDILEVQGSYHIDIRDIYSREWRRHRTLVTSGQQRDYRQVARYRMRSIGDAAELFVLLYKFITRRWESCACTKSPPSTSGSSSTQSPVTTQSTRCANPLGLPDEVLDKFFEKFICKGASRDPGSTVGGGFSCHESKSHRPRIQSAYHALHADFIDAGALKHDRSSGESETVRLTLWVGCLPYSFPEHELPVCLVVTDINIFLFHLFYSNCPVSIKSLRTIQDVQQVLQCVYSMPVRSLNEVVIGLYDQGFRLEVRLDGPRGTFTFLTRDSEKTGIFLEKLYEALGESSEDENSLLNRRISFKSKTKTMPSFIYPDEDKLTNLKKGLANGVNDKSVHDEDLLMYSIVREMPDTTTADDRETGLLTRRLRSLIVMNSKIFLCDEDHVHWPLPSFVRAQPSTPQWVVTKWQEIKKIIGIDVFELVNACEFVGMFGLSLIFDDEDVAEEEVEGMSVPHREPNCWNLIFRSLYEREQLQRSLAQVWKAHFEADLKVTQSKARALSLPTQEQKTDLLGFHDSLSSAKNLTPVGTPVDATFKKSHRRVGSDSYTIFKALGLDCLESLVALDRTSLDGYFHKMISQKTPEEEETLLHVLWTGCKPYLFPLQEIQVCVLLSNLFVYILADSEHKVLISKKKSINLRSSDKDQKKSIYFNFIAIKSLRQVCVGLFDQTVRLEAGSPEETFTFVTREFNVTSGFLECLNAVLLSERPSSQQTDASNKSIYDAHSTAEAYHDTWSKSEFLHSNVDVKYVYPSDDTLEILKDSIAKFSQESDLCSSLYDITILIYLLVFHSVEPEIEEPRTLVIMDRSLCLCTEDHVNYPLTLFATGLPENPQYRVWDVRDVETLSRVEFSDFNSCDFTMVFTQGPPECEENHEDFESASMGELCVITPYTVGEATESTWTIAAPTYEEKEKALSLICKLWCDIHGGALPVMKAGEKAT